MAITVNSTLTPVALSFNEWRRNTNKTTYSVGDLTTAYNSDGTSGDLVSIDNANYIISNISGITVSNGTTVTVVCAKEHNLYKDGSVFDTIKISGITPAEYNGTFAVASVIDDLTFTYTLGATPTAYVSGGVVSYNTSDIITLINDLNSRKVKRSGDRIDYLHIDDVTDVTQYNPTPSADGSTGSLIVAGGAAIAKKLHLGSDFVVNTNKFTVTGTSGNTVIAGTVDITDATASISSSTGALKVVGGAGIQGTIYAGAIQNTPIGSVTEASGKFTTLISTNTTDNTLGSTNSGAIQFAGGMWVGLNATIGGDLRIKGGDLTIEGSPNIQATATANNVGLFDTTTGAITLGSYTSSAALRSQIITIGSSGASKYVSILNDDDSTSILTGALKVAGGVGIVKSLYVGGTIYGNAVQNTPIGSVTEASGKFTTIQGTDVTASTSSSTGALRIAGGAGIAGAIYAGSIQNTPIGSTTAHSGAFTTITRSDTASIPADNNTSQVITSAWYVGQASSTLPAINGTATIGTSLKWSRDDHIHPIDTTRLAKAGDTATGKISFVAGSGSISGSINIPYNSSGNTAVTGDLYGASGSLLWHNNTAVKTLAFTDSTITGNAANVTGTVAIANGGTGLTSVGGANYVVGANAANNALEYKQVLAGTGITISHSSNTLSISNNGALPVDASSPSAIQIGQNLLVGAASTSSTKTISNASWTNNIITFASNGHGLTNGQWVIITGVNPSGYNGKYIIQNVGLNTFDVINASNPGAYSNGGTAYYQYSSVTTTNGFEVRPGAGLTLTNLLVLSSTNDGTVTPFKVNASGDLSINNAGVDKFTVTAATGNTTIVGTLASGAFTCNSTATLTSTVSVTDNTTLGTTVGKTTTFGVNTVIQTATVTSSSTSNVVVASYNAATYSSCEFIIQGKDGSTNIIATKILTANSSGTVNWTEYARIIVGSSVIDETEFSVAINGGNVELTANQANPDVGNSTVWNITMILTKA